MKAFYAYGERGKYVEYDNGDYADTVVSDTNLDMTAVDALSDLLRYAHLDITWVGVDDWAEWTRFVSPDPIVGIALHVGYFENLAREDVLKCGLFR